MKRLRLDKKSWDLGFEAGRRRDPADTVPRDVEVLSYQSGYIEGQAEAENNQ